MTNIWQTTLQRTTRRASAGVALAALLAGKLDFRGKTVGIVLSGGNVDTETFAQAITGTA